MPKRPSNIPPPEEYNPCLDPNHEKFDPDFFTRVIVNRHESITPSPAQPFITQASGDMTPLEKQVALLNASGKRAKRVGTVVDSARTRIETVGEPFSGLEEQNYNDTPDNDELAEDLADLDTESEQSREEELRASEHGDKDSIIPPLDEEAKLDADAAEMEKIATILSVVEEIENGLKLTAIYNTAGTFKDVEKIKIIVDNIFKAESDEEILAICKDAGVSTEENNDDDLKD